MGTVITFGELMLKLAAQDYKRICQSVCFDVEYSGAEANVAVSLAKFGVRTIFVSKLPCNALGDTAIERLKSYGVQTDRILRGGDRIGIYFSEKGASQRPSAVIYDRSHSSISDATISDFDWDVIFSGAEWFHFTGITPALSPNVAEICKIACKKAKEYGLTVSCDLNFRSKLWPREQACMVMSELCEYVDICFANESDATNVFGIESLALDGNVDHETFDSYRVVAESLFDRFKFKLVCITLRTAYSASDNGWSAIMYDGEEFYNGDKYRIHVVDRIGGGDSFCAGIIYGLLNGVSKQDSLNFAIAASCLKQTIEGDFNLVTVEEIKSLMKGNSTGRIQR